MKTKVFLFSSFIYACEQKKVNVILKLGCTPRDELYKMMVSFFPLMELERNKSLCCKMLWLERSNIFKVITLTGLLYYAKRNDENRLISPLKINNYTFLNILLLFFFISFRFVKYPQYSN